MKIAKTRIVFDRHNKATKKVAAPIYIEVSYDRVRNFYNTGIKVCSHQFKNGRVINCGQMAEYQDRINNMLCTIENYINERIKAKETFSLDSLKVFMDNSKKNKEESFIDYVAKRIDDRTDITASTKKSHGKIVSSLIEYGKINSFKSLTKANISDYYEWLLGREITKMGRDGIEYKTKMSVQTIASYMKLLRTYIHDAMLREIIDHDPSAGIRVKRCNYEQSRWLTTEEMKKIEEAELSSGSLVRVRDLFVFSCYCGLAFSDLMDFNPEKLENDGEHTLLYGKRIKTGQEYIVLILPKAQKILEKYGYKLPHYSNQQYNHRLKKVAEEAGIEKNLSSHWGRITFGFMALNKGVRIEVVSKAMGHATISETQRTYSRILKKTVVKEMCMLK